MEFDCGTGAGGFKEGNTCATGESGGGGEKKSKESSESKWDGEGANSKTINPKWEFYDSKKMAQIKTPKWGDYRKTPSDINAAAKAAVFVAQRDNKSQQIIPGNSYMNFVWRIHPIEDDGLTKNGFFKKEYADGLYIAKPDGSIWKTSARKKNAKLESIEPSSENLEVKKKESELADNCGTGAGGFQPGNECAKGGGEGKKVIAYHGTSKEAAEKIEKYGYDMEKSTDGGMWLTPNKEKIQGKETGAGQHGGIVERVIDESKLKLGGWKEYDKYGTDELISQGYDGLKFVDGEDVAYKIFFPEKLSKVIEKSKEFESDCGTGAGGFQPGNTCAGGGEGEGAESKPKFKPSDIDIKIDADDVIGQEYVAAAIARDKSGRALGGVEYSVDGDTAYIKNVVVKPEFRRRGVATNLYDFIYKNHPSVKKIETQGDYQTKEGGAFRKAYDKRKALNALNPSELKMLIAGMMGGIELGKYDGIDFTPPQGARDAAKRALDVREGKPASQKGMTPVGIARARDLMNGVKLSPDTVRRMKAFFDRHEVDKKGATWDEQGKGWQAWNGWGGDAGYAWARKNKIWKTKITEKKSRTSRCVWPLSKRP